jgi:hypothetical protein
MYYFKVYGDGSVRFDYKLSNLGISQGNNIIDDGISSHAENLGPYKDYLP